MAITEESLTRRIKDVFTDVTHAQATDISGGCGASFEVLIVSPEFNKMSTLARHRLVHNKLGTEIKELHAFKQTTYTPEQYSEKKQT